MKYIRKIKKIIIYVIDYIFYSFLMILPIKKDKIVASSFYGKKYENNSRFIIEKYHTLNAQVKIYWIMNPKSSYSVPEFITPVKNKFKSMYHYATSIIWIDTHNIPLYIRRRKKQTYIFSYHAGLGVKKTAADLYGTDRRTDHNSKNVSIAISNSDYLDTLLKGPMNFSGKIVKCGLPKNDIYFNSNYQKIHNKVCKALSLPIDSKLIIYVPSHRQGKINPDAYKIDIKSVIKAFEGKYGGVWKFVIHLHPAEQAIISNLDELFEFEYIDANDYDNMQELMLASDACVSDYSSSIFEVASKNIPCFIFAKDYHEFVKDRAMYFKMEDLPFPVSYNNKQLVELITKYDSNYYSIKWNEFAKANGLSDNGTASEHVAKIIDKIIGG